MSFQIEEDQSPALTRTESRATASACRLRNVLNVFKHGRQKERVERKLPAISPARLAVAAKDEENSVGTKLYLAYGSNLCHETFQGKRGIRPVAALNVVVPTLRMTFDLPGVPYVEPCFANSATRDPTVPSSNPKSQYPTTQEYNKDKWKKGMVGVVYEVTPEDYTHIIATEGGGASYKDVLVKCFPLADDSSDTVPEFPQSDSFEAHTLFAPVVPPNDPEHHNGRFSRPDPSYAQPSARYLKLITDGADEHSLPREYKDYLHGIRPYEARGVKTRLGGFVFQMMWLPFMLMLFALMQSSADKDGKVPAWVAKLGAAIFGAIWTSYDSVFKPIFGDGERTDYSKKQAKSEALEHNRSAGDEKSALATSYNNMTEKC